MLEYCAVFSLKHKVPTQKKITNLPEKSDALLHKLQFVKTCDEKTFHSAALQNAIN